ncbi:Aggrecan core protein [Aphelenchoides avenae]|nr:Aggrecan core protein [Aphelenchus avenae]
MDMLSVRALQLTKPCDPGWEMDAHHCYLTVPERLSWVDAQTACHKEKASLATIFDPAGQRMLKLKGGNLEFWIGLNDRKTKGVFEWDQYNGVDVLIGNR